MLIDLGVKNIFLYFLCFFFLTTSKHDKGTDVYVLKQRYVERNELNERNDVFLFYRLE